MNAADNPAAIVAAANADPSQMGWITTELDGASSPTSRPISPPSRARPRTWRSSSSTTLARDHYFMSASAAEIADLDSGVHTGWVRTGLSFKAYAGNAAPARARLPLLPSARLRRFALLFGVAGRVLRRSRRCIAGFVYETPATFYIGLPDTVTGACAARMVARVSRLGQPARHQPSLHDEHRRAPADARARLDRRRLRTDPGHHVRASVSHRRAGCQPAPGVTA